LVGEMAGRMVVTTAGLKVEKSVDELENLMVAR
jgi:hypothetical protein